MATKKIIKAKIPGAEAYLPEVRTLPALRSAVQKCQGCDLYRNATQAVFGESDAGTSAEIRMMLVGEQPGDKEDKDGHPFVGPAGKFLDRCLEEAGIDRTEVFVTNAVKHFKWEPRGKIRLHKKPNSSEIFACSPWLRAEADAVKPELIVCLGATAAQALLGATFRVTKAHGEIQQAEGWPAILATAHPASILRARMHEDRHRQTAEFVEDLRQARAFLRKRRDHPAE